MVTGDVCALADLDTKLLVSVRMTSACIPEFLAMFYREIVQLS